MTSFCKNPANPKGRCQLLTRITSKATSIADDEETHPHRFLLKVGLGFALYELEDLSLRYLDPAGHDQLIRALDEKRRITDDLIREIESTLKGELEKAGIACTISGRRKHLYSIYKKIKRQRIDVSEVYDYIAFRVITGGLKECYGALGVIHGRWRSPGGAGSSAPRP